MKDGRRLLLIRIDGCKKFRQTAVPHRKLQKFFHGHKTQQDLKIRRGISSSKHLFTHFGDVNIALRDCSFFKPLLALLDIIYAFAISHACYLVKQILRGSVMFLIQLITLDSNSNSNQTQKARVAHFMDQIAYFENQIFHFHHFLHAATFDGMDLFALFGINGLDLASHKMASRAV